MKESLDLSPDLPANLTRHKKYGYIHANPLPTEEELKKLYANTFYSECRPYYFNSTEEDAEWLDASYGERYDQFEKYLTPERRNILDIGSGPGHFLLHGKKRGWKGFGIEPGSAAVEYARNILRVDVVHGFFGPDCKFEKQFDAIHMSEVLEHVLNPEEILQTTRALMQSGGVIGISVPNDFNPIQLAVTKKFNLKKWWITFPEHLNYFSKDTLTSLVEGCGFKVVHTTSTFPIDMFLAMGDIYIDEPTLGKQCHKRRKTFENTLDSSGLREFRQRWYKAMADLDIGREIVCYAVAV